MGCGEAEISQHFKEDTRFKFTNYDHVAFDEDIVTSCDISNVPDEDNSTEVVILSLAMWGSNCHDYITEAYRILETGGTLYIIEPTKRWSVKDGLFNIVEGSEAVELRSLLLEKGFNIIDEQVNKFSMFTCVKHK
jgi:ubiquinone/menaquinone biosynthesis C-methylase UbiE